LLRSRSACLERNEEEREALALELGAVASLCRLVHERTFSLVSSPDLHDEVERLISEMQLQDQAIGELAAAANDVEREIELTTEEGTGVRVAVLEEVEEEDDDDASQVVLRAGGMR
jgi:hypothetical protein